MIPSLPGGVLIGGVVISNYSNSHHKSTIMLRNEREITGDLKWELITLRVTGFMFYARLTE